MDHNIKRFLRILLQNHALFNTKSEWNFLNPVTEISSTDQMIIVHYVLFIDAAVLTILGFGWALGNTYKKQKSHPTRNAERRHLLQWYKVYGFCLRFLWGFIRLISGFDGVWELMSLYEYSVLAKVFLSL